MAAVGACSSDTLDGRSQEGNENERMHLSQESVEL